MRARVLPLLVALAACPLAMRSAAAEPLHLEISPFAGYRWDGQADSDGDLFSSTLDLDDSGAFGVRLDVPVSHRWQIEIAASRQKTRLLDNGGILADAEADTDVTVDTVHLGALVQGGNGQVLPYAVFSLGASRLDPSAGGGGGDARLSASGGGGVKVFVNQHFGFRFEGRLYWIDTDESDDTFSVSDLVQGEATVGAIFAF
jgi:outer membrane protein with beta-barrel domain